MRIEEKDVILESLLSRVGEPTIFRDVKVYDSQRQQIGSFSSLVLVIRNQVESYLPFYSLAVQEIRSKVIYWAAEGGVMNLSDFEEFRTIKGLTIVLDDRIELVGTSFSGIRYSFVNGSSHIAECNGMAQSIKVAQPRNLVKIIYRR